MMITIGITGIIGSGKTTASAALKDRGVPVIDLDFLAKKALTLKEVHEDITRELGSGFVVDGEIVVEKLRDIVFTDKQKLTKLEDIIHPRVRAQLWQTVRELEDSGKKVVIVEHNATGQLTNLFKINMHKKSKISSCLKYDGNPFTKSYVKNAIKEVL